jgi:hypothetical protein
MLKLTAEMEAVRTTIVGGRPPGCGRHDVAVPRGLEVLIKKAAVDEEFRQVLLTQRGDAAVSIGLELDPAENAMLRAIPGEYLAMIIRQTVVPAEHRRRFMGKVAAAMLAVLGVGLAVVDDPAQGAQGTAGNPQPGAGVASRPDTPATSAPASAQRQTVIRVIGPDGQPVAGAVLYVYDDALRGVTQWTRPSPRVADENGEYRWGHPAFTDAIQVYAGHTEYVPDVAQVTIRLSPSDMLGLKVARPLTGRLLLADGSVAQGWFVGQSGSMMGASAGHTPSISVDYGPEGLLPVNAAGDFQLLMTSETLIAVSPEGVPLLFNVNPANWPKAGQHLVITLPRTRTVERGVVVDEAGKPVANMPIHAAPFFTEGCNAFMSLGNFGSVPAGQAPPHTDPPPAALTDAAGRFAIPVPWGTHITPDSADRAFSLTRDATDRFVRKANPYFQPQDAAAWQPPPPPPVFTGRVLDSAGAPVAGAEVRFATMDTGTSVLRWSGYSGRTDAAGRFTVALPAGNWYVQVAPNSAPDGGLTGWTAPSPVPSTARNMDISLTPGGRIRILLPAALEHAIAEAVLENAGLTSGDANSLLPLTYDPADRSLIARGAPPGTYTLQIASAPELADILQRPLTVKAGEESRLDFRDQPLPPSARGAIRWVNLKLLDKAQPAAGVQVGVYAERYPPELVDGWIRQWQNGDAAARAAILPRLKAAGAAVTDRLAVLKPEERDNLRPQLTSASAGFFEGNDFTRVTVDVSDDKGLVRFQGQAGRDYVVCALAPGRGMALERITLAPAGDPSLTLQPTRPLVFHMPPNQPPPRVEETSSGRIDMRLNILEPSGARQRAWMRLLTEGRTFFNRADLDLRGTGSDEQFDDLPAGAVVEVSSYQHRFDGKRTITIQPGEGPVVINPAP